MSRWKRRKHLTWGELTTEQYQIIWCASQHGCKREWGKKAHEQGRVDWTGFIHWDGMLRHTNIRGLRHYLKMVALVLNQPWMKDPRWLQLYRTNVWAHDEAARRFHVRLPSSETAKDRQYILDRTYKIRLRTQYPSVYYWLHRAADRDRARQREGRAWYARRVDNSAILSRSEP